MRIIYLGILCFLFSCTNRIEPYTDYLNHNDTLSYVGIESCMVCHYEIYQSYIQTGMGQSMSLANPQNSEAVFGNSSFLKDTLNQLTYFPFWEDSLLKIKEIHAHGKRTEIADYIVGSGHHTNSHLWEENGYVHQMPFTYYTQDGKLDFPPGFENGFNSRFTRSIGLECMSCHNAMPDFVKGSENKFTKVPNGIDCERCHGPGELHVQRMMKGELVDTAKQIDYSIVNPKKLSLEAQFQICMRCHLQGNTVLEEGKSFMDFKPGMKLSDFMTVFVPRYEDDNSFIMASHVDRFKQSACFINSEMNCTSCHNPHHSVQKKAPNFFNNKCLSCHDDCKDEFREGNNCVECHMPSSSTIDIPHVSIHDHKIGIHLVKDSVSTKGKFIGLEAINNSRPKLLTRAKAYLYQYEKFDAQDYLLDSAYALLQKLDVELAYADLIHLYYLKNDFSSVVNVSKSIDGLLSRLNSTSYSNTQAWTSFRIAYAYDMLNSNLAKGYYEKAVELAPFVLKFRLKLGDFYSKSMDLDNAEKQYRTILEEFSKDENVWCNLGFVLVQKNNFEEANQCYDRALSLNPIHVQSLLNKASLLIIQGDINKGKLYLNRILEIDSTNEKVKSIMSTL